jgi:hypothetical protein
VNQLFAGYGPGAFEVHRRQLLAFSGQLSAFL